MSSGMDKWDAGAILRDTQTKAVDSSAAEDIVIAAAASGAGGGRSVIVTRYYLRAGGTTTVLFKSGTVSKTGAIAMVNNDVEDVQNAMIVGEPGKSLVLTNGQAQGLKGWVNFIYR